MLQELLKAASNSTSVTYRTVHCMQKSPQELCKFTSSSQDLSIIYLRVVNSHRFNQSDLDTRSWYHGTAASKECLQALLSTPSSPDRSRLVPLPLGYLALNPALNPACSQAINAIAYTIKLWMHLGGWLSTQEARPLRFFHT